MDVTTPVSETTSPIGRAIYKLGRFISPIRDVGQRIAGVADVATQEQSPNLTDDDLYFFGLLEKTQPGANQSKIIRDMIERRPDLQTEIMSLSKQAVAASPNIGRDDLMNVVAKGLDAEALDKADRAMLEEYGLDPDAMVQPPEYTKAYPQRIFTKLEEESDEYPWGREDFIDQEFAKDVDLGIVPSDPVKMTPWAKRTFKTVKLVLKHLRTNLRGMTTQIQWVRNEEPRLKVGGSLYHLVNRM